MKSYVKNYLFNLTYQILLIVLPLVTAPYLARIFGADRIGEYSFAQSIVAYFVLFSALGTSIYGQRCIARCKAENKPVKTVFEEIVLLRLCSVGLFLLIYLALVFSLAPNRWLYILAGIEIICVAFDISWFYQGIERFEKITWCNGLSKIAGAIAVFAFIHTKDDLELYVLLFT